VEKVLEDISPRPRVSTVLACLLLLFINRIDAAHTVLEPSGGLVQHNIVSNPYLAYCPPQQVARVPRKTSTPVRNDFKITTTSEDLSHGRISPSLPPVTKHASTQSNRLALEEKRPSPIVRSNSRPVIQVGYGNVFRDDSRTAGMKTETKSGEPGCFYVKTTFVF
jgi:hypothetical protein